VICSPSALTGGPDIVAELGICPRGYMEVRNNRITTDPGLPGNPGGNFNRRTERMADSMRRDNERRAAEREAARQREHEANLINQQMQFEQQAQRRATARLPEASRCLQGTWYIEAKVPNRDAVTAKLDVGDNGDIYWEGVNMSDGSLISNRDSSGSATLVNNNIYISVNSTEYRMRISLSLSGQSLIGKNVVIGIKKGFFTDKELPPEEYEMTGARVSATPSGCESDIEPSSNSRSSSSEVRGETIADGLRNLSELHEQEILTDEEFNAAKRRLLGL
jgi:hypothetical protein